MANPVVDELARLVDQMKLHDKVPVRLLLAAHDHLAAALQKGGEHVAPVPDVDPEAIKAELAEAERRAAALRERIAGQPGE